jgi:hypothetical protein
VIVTITEKTVAVSKKGETPVDFEKLAKAVEKGKELGKKGAMVKIEHEKGIASKIQVQFKKKADPTH